jgi:hypothetical protein
MMGIHAFALKWHGKIVQDLDLDLGMSSIYSAINPIPQDGF